MPKTSRGVAIVFRTYAMPYEKLKEISKLKKKSFLKPGVTFEQLDKIAYQFSDNEFAKILRKQERVLFDKISEIKVREGGSRQTAKS